MKWISVEQAPPPLNKWIYMTRNVKDPEATSKQRLGGRDMKTPADADAYCKEVGFTHWKPY